MAKLNINGKVRDVQAEPDTPLLWVTCGRRPGKCFLTFLQHWSGAVTCPAC